MTFCSEKKENIFCTSEDEEYFVQIVSFCSKREGERKEWRASRVLEIDFNK